MSVAETDLPPGTVVGGDFRVVRPLAAGGMGAVYVAEQISTARPRALKVMRRDLVGTADVVQRFVLEARVAARIRSDHVVEVVSAGFDAPLHLPWLAMELLEGRSLDGVLRDRGALPPHEALDVLGQVGAGLAAAHAAGVVHRDLKPENVFVSVQRDIARTTRIKILDFGIAKVLAEANALSAMTVAVGSPRWMAPEQTEVSAAVSPATDVWAFGLLAYRVLTGRYFWRAAAAVDGANIAQMLREVIADPIPPPSARAAEQGVGALVPPGFDAWFARCVARDPWARFPTAREAVDTLALVLHGSPAAFGPTPTSGTLRSADGHAPLTSAAETAGGPSVLFPAPPLRAASPQRGWIAAGMAAILVLTTVAGLLIAHLAFDAFDGLLEEEEDDAPKVAPAPIAINGQWAIAEGVSARGVSYSGESFILVNGPLHSHETKAFAVVNGQQVAMHVRAWSLLQGDHYAFAWAATQAGLFVYTVEGGRLTARIAAPPAFETVETETVEGSPALSGLYQITASSRGMTGGTMTLIPDGARWRVERRTAHGVALGVALRDKNLLVVGVGPPGVQVGVHSYRVQPGGEAMIGVTTDTDETGVGRESLSRRHELPGTLR